MRKLILVGLTTALMLVPLPVSADPIDDARTRVNTLQHEAEALGQDFVDAQERHKAAEKKLQTAKVDVLLQSREVLDLKGQAGDLALSQIQEDALSTTLRIVTSSEPDDLIHRLGLIDQIQTANNDKLLAYQQESAKLEELKEEAALHEVEAALQEERAEESKAKAEAKLEEAEEVLDNLTEEQRERIAAQERSQAREAQEAVIPVKVPKKADKPSEEPAAPPAGSRGARALAYAQAQVGDPYVFGAMGPDAFDCSGLTSAAWKSVGITLPRTSQAQFGAGSPVSRSELALGDLVFFYSGISHVGLYAGNGMVLHASKPGSPVGYLKMSYMPYAGARRPG
jgi:cell wall-associated NlpC family hydrolase